MDSNRLIHNTIFSPCRTFRYTLWREWMFGNGYAMVIGLNPSTADENTDDPTVRRCISYAKAWGYGAFCMTNIFAFRATDPNEMLAVNDPIGPENDRYLRDMAADAGIVVAAWGTLGAHLGRAAVVQAMLPDLHVLRLTKDGHPGHPLYLLKHLKPVPWDPAHGAE